MPSGRLNVRPLSLDVDFERLLEEGELDVVIGNWPRPPEYLRTTPLFDDEVVHGCRTASRQGKIQSALTTI